MNEGILYKKRGLGMFVSPDAQETLRAQHRVRLFTDVVDPMVAEARTIGIPLREIIGRLEALANEDET